MRVAILGATGHIGRCLALAYAPRAEVTLFARRPEAASAFALERDLTVEIAPSERLGKERFDLIVNAVGFGLPGRSRVVDDRILDVTAQLDQLCLDALERHPETAYVFLSTGAVYGPGYREATEAHPALRLPLDGQQPGLFYALAKATAELRHRSRPQLRIADLRIFGFVSGEIPFDSELLLAQMLGALCAGEVFRTRPDEAPRDYIGPDDLVRLIDVLIERACPNGAYDILSAAPTSKFRVLDALAERFGLEHRVEGGARGPLVPLPERLSIHREAEYLGYRPGRSSLDQVLYAASELLAERAARPREERV